MNLQASFGSPQLSLKSVCGLPDFFFSFFFIFIPTVVAWPLGRKLLDRKKEKSCSPPLVLSTCKREFIVHLIQSTIMMWQFVDSTFLPSSSFLFYFSNVFIFVVDPLDLNYWKASVWLARLPMATHRSQLSPHRLCHHWLLWRLSVQKDIPHLCKIRFFFVHADIKF